MRAVAFVLVLSACGRDVQLGTNVDAGIDSLIDAMPSPFTPGTYTLTYIEPNETSCDGTLANMGNDFSTITAASLGLVDGDVMLVGVNEVVIRLLGAPISSGYNRAMVDLTPNPEALPPDSPQTIWDTVVAEDFGVGPLGTHQLARYFGIDSASANMPSQMQSAAALYYETEDMSGACFITFAAVLASQ